MASKTEKIKRLIQKWKDEDHLTRQRLKVKRGKPSLKMRPIRSQESLRVFSEITGIPLSDLKDYGHYHKSFNKASDIVGDYPKWDHCDYIFTKTGKQLGCIINPYVDLDKEDIENIESLGFYVIPIGGDGWHAPKLVTYPYAIIRNVKEIQDNVINSTVPQYFI